MGAQKKSRKTFCSFFVPRIGLEPTCREALAPETSVSTISPPGLRFGLQRYNSFFIYQQKSKKKCERIFLPHQIM